LEAVSVQLLRFQSPEKAMRNGLRILWLMAER
jgi:hypothetical protein